MNKLLQTVAGFIANNPSQRCSRRAPPTRGSRRWRPTFEALEGISTHQASPGSPLSLTNTIVAENKEFSRGVPIHGTISRSERKPSLRD